MAFVKTEIQISTRTVLKVLLLIAAFLFSLQLAHLLIRELTWVGIAFFLALALEPAVSRLAHIMPKRNRGLAAGIVLILAFGLLAFVVMALAPPLAKQTTDLVTQLPNYAAKLADANNPVSNLIRDQHLIDQLRSEQSQLLGQVSGSAGSIFGVLASVFSSLVAFLTIIALTFFMVMEGPGWAAAFWRVQPEDKREHRKQLAAEMHKTVTGYVNGNLFTSLIAAVAVAVTLTIIGVPFAIPLGILVGIVDLLPLVGATIAAIVVTLLALLYGGVSQAIIMLVFFIIYQQVENHVLQPLVYSRTVKISPLIVLIAAIFGAVLAGLIGALVAIPVAASLQILITDYFDNHYHAKS